MRRAFLVLRGLLLGLVAAFAPRAFAGDLKGFVVVYDGWGTQTSFVVSGRVLESQDEIAAEKTASGAVNLIENIKALESDEVRFADVHVTIAGQQFAATTDDDGNFKVQVKGLPASQALPLGPLPVTVSLVKAPGRKPEQLKVRAGNGHVYVYDEKLAFTAIVSDIDDTIVKTYVTDKKKMIGAVLFSNALQLEPVAGASPAYRKARDGGVLGYFYLSGSPQNFYLRLQSYLAAQEFPAGPLLLKNFGNEPLTKQHGYKLDRLENLVAALPLMKIIAIGDTGEADPEIFAEFRKRPPHRVHAIVIRKTPGTDVRPERFPNMTTFDDGYPDDAVIARLLAPGVTLQPAPPGGSR